ncbi:metallophosphoesterase [Anaerobacillus sp. MEB173]|uniref:metallophosphoesterase n=1 Tax=Anaerobacillus sp. MEB173 TaxID=3383345 RepID=UPI003F8DA153
MLYLLLLFVVFASGGLLLYMWKEANKNLLVETELYLDGLPSQFDGTKLFFISDIHKRVVSTEIIEKAKGKADIAIIGGDLTEKKVPFERVEENIKRIKQIGPTYFVWGNNDYEADFRKLDALFLEQRVKILDNTAVYFEQDGARLVLLGVDDVSHHRDRLDLALKDSEEGFRVLVSHDPKITEKLSEDDGISLILSGHTHGGQIRFFGYGIREKGGIKKIGDRILVVSNGYGTTSVPLRLSARAETHLFTLKTNGPR